MARLTFLIFACFALAACNAPTLSVTDAQARPMRIVSLDYCADQYVLKFADADQILAISPDGVRHFSYMREAARGVPTVRSRAEDVLILKPDLVVRSYGGGPNAAAFFERAGVPVLQVGWANSVRGDTPGSIAHLVQSMADGLGHHEKGRAVVADYLTRLSELEQAPSQSAALYMTRSGVTTGEGTLAHDLLLAAGLTNFAERSGWHSLPLERLAYRAPDLVAAAFFDTPNDPRYRWSASRHPIAQRELARANTVDLPGAWTSCGAWFMLDAVEALNAGARP